MIALKSERKIFQWLVAARPTPKKAEKPVTLNEIVSILERQLTAGKARCYLSPKGRILGDTEINERNEKNQIYIAEIRRDDKNKTITFLINRGDPEAVTPAVWTPGTQNIRQLPLKQNEVQAWSAHLVVSTKLDNGRHRACYEQMPHVSSSLALNALADILERAVKNDPKYVFDVVVKKATRKAKAKIETRKYRPHFDANRIPSETLLEDLANGQLSRVVLTRRTEFYAGPGPDRPITRQEERIVLTTASETDKNKVIAFVRDVFQRGKQEHFETVTFTVDDLPGGGSGSHKIPLSDQDALEHLHARAQLVKDFGVTLEGCYPNICKEIEGKMIALIKGDKGWS